MSTVMPDPANPSARLKKNTPALISLCLGLVSCVPLVGIAAAVLGVIGLNRARDPRTVPGTRPVAAMGVILGVLGVFWSVMLASGVIHGYYNRQAEPAIAAQTQFLRVLGSGNVNAARGMCAEAIDETDLTDAFAEFEAHGALLGDIDNRYGGQIHSRADVEVTSALKFEKATRLFTGHWTVEAPEPKLLSFAWKDAPATQPARE